MLEQVRSLRVDLEDVINVEEIQVEPLSHMFYCRTTNYRWCSQRYRAISRSGVTPDVPIWLSATSGEAVVLAWRYVHAERDDDVRSA